MLGYESILKGHVSEIDKFVWEMRLETVLSHMELGRNKVSGGEEERNGREERWEGRIRQGINFFGRSLNHHSSKDYV